MPPKRKYTSYVGANKKQAPTSSAEFTAKVANNANLQAELTKLLAGQQFSQAGYVYVTVNSENNNYSSDPSQDPFASQHPEESQAYFQDEQSFDMTFDVHDDEEAAANDPDSDRDTPEIIDEEGPAGSDAIMQPMLMPSVPVVSRSENETRNGLNADLAGENKLMGSGEQQPEQQHVAEDLEVVAPDCSRNADCQSCNGKNDELRKLRKKVSAQAHEIACLKDNVAFITGELQEAKDKNKFPSITFTTDPHINMSIEELKAVDSASQTDSIFVSNIAIHFYGTERLKGMSVTGQPTPRFKNVRREDGSLLYPPREQIEPNVFKFICEKLVERVAQRLGPSKVKEIAYFANEHIVRKHIAQKIGNLNKVAARRRE